MKVTQMINSKGNAASNQFIINTDKGQYFQSYQTLIAFKPRSGCTPILSDSWDYSTATLKHLKLFLGTDTSKKEIQKQIDNGSIILDNSLTIK